MFSDHINKFENDFPELIRGAVRYIPSLNISNDRCFRFVIERKFKRKLYVTRDITNDTWIISMVHHS